MDRSFVCTPWFHAKEALLWRSALRTLFNPEDSSRWQAMNRWPGGVFHRTIKGSSASAKTLIWIVISILLGLALGQL